MAVRSWISAMVLLIAACLPLVGQSNMKHPQAWSGVIINGNCTAEEAFVEAPKCTEIVPGASLALYDDTIRKVFVLDPQGPAKGMLGKSVTVRGTLEGSTIHVASLHRFSSIGLPVGRKAPDFSLRDQFGRVQTLDTLKGPSGTVILFFRSADW